MSNDSINIKFGVIAYIKVVELNYIDGLPNYGRSKTTYKKDWPALKEHLTRIKVSFYEISG